MILICRKSLAGMHFQVRNDPDMREKSVRDAFARGESDPDLLKYQLRDACGAAKCIRKSRKTNLRCMIGRCNLCKPERV